MEKRIVGIRLPKFCSSSNNICFALYFISFAFLNVSQSAQVKVRILNGYKISPIPNVPNLLEIDTANEDYQCIIAIFDEPFTAASFDRRENKCIKNLYGRVLLERDADSKAYIKGTFMFFYNILFFFFSTLIFITYSST